jgi:hypothetical protein
MKIGKVEAIVLAFIVGAILFVPVFFWLLGYR